MATPDITLNNNEILLTQVESGLGIYQDNNPFINGNVEMINDLEDIWRINDLVLFDPTYAIRFVFDNITYYLISTNKIQYKENYIPPP